MSPKPRTVLTAVLLLLVVAVALGSQSRLATNAFYALRYERTLDAYAQVDTTTTELESTVDASGRPARLLSAFFGLDDALPRIASLVACEGAGGKDGMPVIFSHELDAATVQPGDFKVTTTSGAVGEVTCLTMAPADDSGELRTVLLIGQYGSADDQPASVDIVGNILDREQTVNFKGASIEVTALEAGPGLVMAESLPESEWKLGEAGTGIPFGGGTGCPGGTKHVIRVTWAGGVTKPDGSDADATERDLYVVTLLRDDGSTYQAQPAALADLRDGDNNHKLCLDTTDAVLSVSFPAGYLADPRDDLNPATSVSLGE